VSTGGPLVVRVRLFIAGAVVDEISFPVGVGTRDLIGELGARHGELVAAHEGAPYLVEFKFPDGDHVRFGTDAEGMVEPFPVALEHLTDAIARRYR
jgi:hypothetical protein